MGCEADPEKVDIVFDGISVEAQLRNDEREPPTLPNAVFNGVKVTFRASIKVCWGTVTLLIFGKIRLPQYIYN
jgi:hypothetical protein